MFLVFASPGGEFLGGNRRMEGTAHHTCTVPPPPSSGDSQSPSSCPSSVGTAAVVSRRLGKRVVNLYSTVRRCELCLEARSKRVCGPRGTESI